MAESVSQDGPGSGWGGVVKHLDLFSGIGGFALAARWVGWETVGFCEIDPYCQKVLAKNFTGVPIYDDVRTLDARTVGHVDIITGGYPCQPFSVAGERRGEKDDRHLWPEAYRLLRDILPRWACFENVAGHISMGLDTVLSDMEGIGYTWEALVIPACAVDAKHRRDRIWIVAHTDRANSGDKWQNKMPNHGKLDQWQAKPDNNGDEGAVADTNLAPGERNQRTKRGEQARTVDGEYCRWLPEPPICRVANGIPNRSHRLRGLGNAIVPQVAEVIFRAIDKATST